MQDDLFGDPHAAPVQTKADAPPHRSPLVTRGIAPQPPTRHALALAAQLPTQLWLGTLSWSYPGWAGLVWAGTHTEAALAKDGLTAYSQHPLLRAVGIDRSFYRPLTASQYARYAAQVPDRFRFVVKAPGAVSDALIRAEGGRGQQTNPLFLNPVMAVQEFVQPALEGLGAKAGALVFQLSPLPGEWLARPSQLLDRLADMLRALPRLAPVAPDAVVAVEVRDPQLLTPALAHVLKSAGATYCLGLHAKMPPVAGQLDMLRALWPGPMVCRWNLNPLHGAYGYEDAHHAYSPYHRLVDVDVATRDALARVARATTRAGHHAYITISNKAEGSAPLSVQALAEAVAADAPP